jgi:hypothetical protein
VSGTFFVHSFKLKNMNTTIERLIEIDSEREATMSDVDFQRWMKELNISASCINKDPIFRATEMMKDYDFSKLVFLS